MWPRQINGIHVRFNPIGLCWEFIRRGKIIESCDDSELSETFRRIADEQRGESNGSLCCKGC